jgi:hypothetical protein
MNETKDQISMTPLEFRDLLAEGNELTVEIFDQFIRDCPKEGQYLEYKAGTLFKEKGLKEIRGIIKEYVSSFANAAGGVLVLGPHDKDPSRVTPCPNIPKGRESLDTWAEKSLQDMAHLLVPPPCIKMLSYGEGAVLVIAVHRSPSLVPCVSNNRMQYYLRMAESTLPVPEYLLTDLFHERRRLPTLELKAQTVQADWGRRPGDLGAPLYISIQLVVENIGLLTAKDIRIGIVMWQAQHRDRPKPLVNNFLLSHVRIEDVGFNRNAGGGDFLVFEEGLVVSDPFDAEPFQAASKVTLRYAVSKIEGRNVGAIFLMTEGGLLNWYELIFLIRPERYMKYDQETLEARLERVFSRRPRVALERKVPMVPEIASTPGSVR